MGSSRRRSRLGNRKGHGAQSCIGAPSKADDCHFRSRQWPCTQQQQQRLRRPDPERTWSRYTCIGIDASDTRLATQCASCGLVRQTLGQGRSQITWRVLVLLYHKRILHFLLYIHTHLAHSNTAHNEQFSSGERRVHVRWPSYRRPHDRLHCLSASVRGTYWRISRTVRLNRRNVEAHADTEQLL